MGGECKECRNADENRSMPTTFKSISKMTAVNWKILEIVAERTCQESGKKEYCVHWANTWEPAEEVVGKGDAWTEYSMKQQQKAETGMKRTHDGSSKTTATSYHGRSLKKPVKYS